MRYEPTAIALLVLCVKTLPCLSAVKTFLLTTEWLTSGGGVGFPKKEEQTNNNDYKELEANKIWKPLQLFSFHTLKQKV